jgi:2-methylcitrate dehydratase PrpD
MAKRRWTYEVAEWAATMKFEDIPQRIVREAKCQILSVLAAILAGARTEVGKRIIAVCGADYGGAGSAYPVFPTTKSACLADALTAATALSLSLDYDDYLISGHTGHSAVIVPLLMASQTKMTGQDFIAAQTAANEIGARVGTSVSIGPQVGFAKISNAI